VHEIAVLADQRPRAGHAFTSGALEEWHGYILPAFTERMKSRLWNQREDGHQPWPAKGRHTRYTAEINRRTRPWQREKCQAPTGTTAGQQPEPRPETVKQLPEPNGQA
jgi:hypothetical protein